MEEKFIRHGTHTLNNDVDGYVYNYNTSLGYDFNSHFHNCYEFIHIIHGQLVYTVEGTDYALSDGDFIMTRPEELHSFSFPSPCEYQREFLHIYPGFVAAYPELTKPLDERKAGYFNRFGRELAEKYGIDKIFGEIERCCTELTPETDMLVFALSLQLLIRIGQVLRIEQPERQEIIKNKKTNAVCDYIDHHYSEDISIDAIAKELYVSQSHISRAFKREMGMSIKSYLNMRRVTRAKNLIIQGQQITSIFLECGFGDYSTFYRAFVKYVGMSPEQFRRTHKRV